MNFKEGLNRLSKVIGIILGILIGFNFLKICYYYKMYRLYEGDPQFNSEFIYLMFVFSFWFFVTYLFVDMIKRIAIWIIEGFQEKRDIVTSSEKTSS